jgi:serine/threonine protein kinase
VILSKVGDIKQLHPVTLGMSPDELGRQRQKRRAELLIRFANAQDRTEADEMLADADAEFEQRQLQAILNSIDPSKIWMPVNRDDVLSGFLPGLLINHGGTSDIHLCWTRFNKHTAVIKLIKYADSKARVDKLLALKEHQTLLKFTHPNIVKVFDAGYLKVLEDGQEQIYPYVAMERLPGQTLESWILHHLPSDTAGNKEWDSWLNTVAEAGAVLAGTLFHCHEKEITHGDFKPNNMHVCGPHPTKDMLKVYDFGFSADEDGHVHGDTIGYADPVVQPRDMDSMKCRDIYALGATLLFCATGKHPPASKDPSTRDRDLRNAISAVPNSDLRIIIQKAMNSGSSGFLGAGV